MSSIDLNCSVETDKSVSDLQTETEKGKNKGELLTSFLIASSLLIMLLALIFVAIAL